MQVKLTKVSYIGVYLKFSLYRILVYSGLRLERFHLSINFFLTLTGYTLHKRDRYPTVQILCIIMVGYVFQNSNIFRSQSARKTNVETISSQTFFHKKKKPKL